MHRAACSCPLHPQPGPRGVSRSNHETEPTCVRAERHTRTVSNDADIRPSLVRLGRSKQATRAHFALFPGDCRNSQTRWRREADLNRRDPSFRACFRRRLSPTSRCHHEWSWMVLSFHYTPVDESSRASTYVRIGRGILTYVKSLRRENLRRIPWESLQPVLELRGEQSTAAAPL